MDIEGVYISSAFIAGLVSFLAPCTLPLLPAYLAFISGVTDEELLEATTHNQARRRIMKSSVIFVLGFSLVFILFGILAGHFGSTVGPFKQVLTKIGGVIVLLFGLFMLGALNIPALSRVRQIRLPSFLIVGRPASSFVLGGIFALGWTPCIGPILATILFLASTTETAFAGGLLLAVFALGLGLPFIIVAFLITRATKCIQKALPYLGYVSRIGGLFLVFLGLLLIWGEFSLLMSWGYGALEWLNYEQFIIHFQ